MRAFETNALVRPNILNLQNNPNIKVRDNSSLHSEGLFNIYDFPTHELGLGNHSFLIYGSEALKPGTDIDIEIQDYNGLPVPIRALLLTTLDPAWIVTFRVNENVSDGPATVYILGTGKDSSKLGDQLWSRTISINKSVQNASNILFAETTTVDISEHVREDDAHANKYRSYVSSSFDNLETVSGQVDLIRSFYWISGSGVWNEMSSITVDSTAGINTNSLQSLVEFQEFSGDDLVKFKFQFINPAGETAKVPSTGKVYELTTDFIHFDGVDDYIIGALLTGSMFIGNVKGSGIVAAGTNSGYIKSVGYEGYAEQIPGFLIWSGSVLPGSSTSYEGVGLELYGASDAYLRFWTNPSFLDIRAKEFFVGNSGSQYIFGSGSVIEISSSNFHLTQDGDVTMSGTITAQDGYIGGWIIGTGSLYATSSTDFEIGMSSENLKFYINDSNGIERIGIGDVDLTFNESNWMSDNGGFEDGDLTPWSVGWDNNAFTYSVESSGNPAEGSYYLKGAPANPGVSDDQEGILYYVLPTDYAQTNENVSVSFYATRENFNWPSGVTAEIYIDKSTDAINWSTVTQQDITFGVKSGSDFNWKKNILNIIGQGGSYLYRLYIRVYGSAGSGYLDVGENLYFDDFKFYVSTPFAKMNDDGLILYNSPNQYLKFSPSGMIAVGFDGADGSSTNVGTIISPYTSTPASVNTTGTAGSSDDYARGDHRHALNINSFLTGTTNQVTVNNDGDGTATLSLPQDIHTGASPTFYSMSLSSNLEVNGNMTVNGTTTTIDTETVLIEDNILVINKNQTGTPLTSLYGGIEVERGDETNYVFLFRELDDSFVIGESGSVQAVATRQDTPLSMGVPYWNDSAYRFDTDSDLTFNGTNLILGNQATGTTHAVRADRNLTFTSDTNVTISNSGTAQNFTSNRSWTLGWTGQLSVSRGGTGQSTLTANKVLVGNGTSGILSPTNLHWDNSNSYLGIGVTSPTSKLHLPQENDSSTPTISFGDGDTGFYEESDDKISISIGGSRRWYFDSVPYFAGSISGAPAIYMNSSTSTRASYSFVGDTNTGIGRASADQLSLIAGGSELLRLDAINNKIIPYVPIELGTIELEEDSGVVTLVNMPISSVPSAGDAMSYSFALDSEPVMTVYGEADGSGGVQNKRIGIRTTNPEYNLDVDGNARFTSHIIANTVGIKTGTTYTGTIKSTNLTGNYNYEFPNYGGTLTVRADLPQVGNGLTQTWNIPDTFTLGGTITNNTIFTDNTNTYGFYYNGVDITLNKVSDSASPIIKLNRAVGTPGSANYPLSNNYLGVVSAGGANQTSELGASAALIFQASEDFDADNQGSKVYISATPIGSNISNKIATFDGSGNVGIGTTSPTKKLEIYGNENDSLLRLQHTSAGYYTDITTFKTIMYRVSSGADYNIITSGSYTGDAGGISFKPLDSLALRIGGSGNSTFYGNIAQVTTEGRIYNGYTSGIFGAGWTLENNYAGITGSFFEVDNARIRGTLAVHIFKKDVVKAANGYLLITDSANIGYQSGSSMYVKQSDDNATFNVGDLIWYKDSNTDGNVTSVKATVATTGSQTITVEDDDIIFDKYTLTFSEGAYSDFKIGGTVVRVGNTTDASRDGSIMLDASSEHSPFIDIYDEVNSWNAFSSVAKTKVRLGKLSGITYGDTSLSGYGLYANRVFLGQPSGSTYNNSIDLEVTPDNARFLITSSSNAIFEFNANTATAYIAGWNIKPGELYNGNIHLDATDQKIYMNGDGTWGSDGFFASGSGYFSLGDKLTWDTSNLVISGSIYAESGYFNGEIVAATGQIAGWNIQTNYLNSGSVYIASNFDAPAGDVTYFGRDTSGNSKLRFEKSLKSFQISNNQTYPYMYIYDGSKYRVIIGDMNPSYSGNTDNYDGVGLKILNTSGETVFGNLSDTVYTIAGWTFDTSKLQKNGVTLDSTGKIYIGSGNYANTDTGFFVSGSGIFSLSDKLYFDGTNLTIVGTVYAEAGSFSGNVSADSGNIGGWNIVTGNLAYGTDIILDATNQQISINNGGMKFGYNVSGTDSGIYIDTNNYWYDDGSFKVYTDSDNYISKTAGGSIDIKSDTFYLSATNITIDSVNSFAQFGNIDISGSASQINLNTDKSNYYLDFDGKDFKLGPNFRVLNGNVTGSNVTLTGDITATTGTLTDLDVDGTITIGAGGSLTNGNVTIDSTEITINSGSINLGSGKFYAGTDGYFSAVSGSIGGWGISTDNLSSGEILISSTSGSEGFYVLDGAETIVSIYNGAFSAVPDLTLDLYGDLTEIDIAGRNTTITNPSSSYNFADLTSTDVPGGVFGTLAIISFKGTEFSYDGSYEYAGVSAVGRVFGFSGTGVDTNYPSAISVANAIYSDADVLQSSGTTVSSSLPAYDPNGFAFASDTLDVSGLTSGSSYYVRTTITITFISSFGLDDINVGSFGIYSRDAFPNVQNFTELTNNGLQIFNDGAVLKIAGADSIVKLPSITTNDMKVLNNLEVYGDMTIFGDIEATALSPYETNPTNISTIASPGNVSDYSRGNHVHAIDIASFITGSTNQITVTDNGNTATLSLPQNIHTGATPTFGGLTVNGNIGVTGTVDGRDIANDGSKLDGIESNAKDDQTITAGNGLTGGGTGDVTLTMGAPSTLTSVTSNGVTTSSHTHAITNYAVSGTANQVTVTGAGKVLGAAVTLSLPQDIHTGATPTFGGLTVTGTITAASIGAGVDNSVVILDSDGTFRTDEIDSRVWGSSLVDGAGSAGHIAYWSDANTVTYDNGQLYWDATNNRLGIGTSLPRAILSVHTDPANTSEPTAIYGSVGDSHTALFIAGTGNIINEKIGIQFGSYVSAGNHYGIGGIYGVMTNVGGNTIGDIAFNLRSLTTDLLTTERMRITSTGNVGIGNGTPSYKLDVNGTFRATGEGYFNSNLQLTGDLKMVGGDCYIWTPNTSAGFTGIWDANNSRVALKYVNSTGKVEFPLGTTTTGDSTLTGDLTINGELFATKKHFYVDNPTKPGEKLIYDTLEGPSEKVYFEGKSQSNIISLPEEWEWLVKEETINCHLTPFGHYQQLYVEKIEGNNIYIKDDNKKWYKRNKMNYSFVVYGERKV